MARTPGSLFLLLLCIVPGAPAITVSDLYEDEIPVADQSTAARKQAVSGALRRVLIKLTGDRRSPDRMALSPILRLAEDYVQQYRYAEAELPAIGESARPTKELRLWVRFDGIALNRDLRDSGVAVWGRERPSTLAWLVVGDASGRNWITAEEHPSLIALIEKRAKTRGIVVLSPLMDLQDSSTLRVSDVWGGFQGPVLQASERYRVDAVLAAAVESPAVGIWEARWTAILEGEVLTWTTESDLLEVTLEEGIDGLADLLAARYVPASVSTSVADVTITVADVSDVDQYARVLQYLQSLNPVEEIRVTGVEPGQVRFLLTAHGGEAAVEQAITLGRVLERLNAAAGNVYRLLP